MINTQTLHNRHSKFRRETNRLHQKHGREDCKIGMIGLGAVMGEKPGDDELFERNGYPDAVYNRGPKKRFDDFVLRLGQQEGK